MKTYLPKLSILFVFLFITSLCKTQPGTLDSSFGANGKLTTHFFNGQDTVEYANASSIQPDGKIVVAGYFYVYDYHANFIIARYKTNGDLDSSFGTNGKVITYFTRAGLATTYPKSVIILPDGKILVGGYRVDAPATSPTGRPPSQSINRYSVMARYMPNGDLDSSFGVNGQVQYLIGAFYAFGNFMSGIVMGKDSSIVTAGYMDGLCVIKFHFDGTVDSSFAVNGKMADPNSNFHTNDIVVDSEERILITGYDYLNFVTPSDFALRRLLLSGIYDSSYGNNGKVITDFNGSSDTIYSVVTLSDGSIIAAGTAFNTETTKRELALAKYKPSGVLDSSFGINGKISTSLNKQSAGARKLLMQADGKLLIAGEINDTDFLVSRFKADGTLDNGFGINGVGSANFEGTSLLTSAALQQDGKIVTAGRPYFSLARFKGDAPIIVSIKKNISITEGNTGTTPALFKIILNKSSTKDVLVNYTTKNLNAIAGTDYTVASGTLKIKAGKTSKNIIVNIIGDNTREANEKFALVLSNPVNAILGTLDSAMCTIKNDDLSFALNAALQNDVALNNASIKIYPNPVSGILNIEGLHSDVNTKISILNLSGIVLANTTTSNSIYSWDIKAIPAGTYFLKIESKENKTVLKFLKQ